MSKAILSFKLGPVQPFIESARTLRDLWSGSYLLSWLAAHGMKVLIDQDGIKFITPDADPTTNPLLTKVLNHPSINGDPTIACLPHTFAALVPAEKAETYRNEILNAVRAEWGTIGESVRKAIHEKFSQHDPKWHVNWQAQIDSLFEFTCVVLPLSQASKSKLDSLGVKVDDLKASEGSQEWSQQWNMQQALLEMARSVRHVPPYTAEPRDGRHPVKCSLFGSYEQMGPADLNASTAFWEAVSSPNWAGIHGTRLQKSDRLCAIALVKRFMWPVYMADRIDEDYDSLKFTDTATMAAKRWLYDGGSDKIDPRRILRWNGQWLHWLEPKNDDGPECPVEVWDLIQKKKKQQGKPPTYYALLMLDGDNMGDFFQGEKGKRFGDGVERFQSITKQLTAFGNAVDSIVEKYGGELIYAGGDDVLAFLPTDQAIECAHQLRLKFEEQLPGGTLSGGIAVVHYKEDLRFALAQARAAEKAAKKMSEVTSSDGKVKKDAFAVTICKRSGEHTTTCMGWNTTISMRELIHEFKMGASDRWTYKLREVEQELGFIGLEAGEKETLRLINRGEFADKTRFTKTIEELFKIHKNELTAPDRGWKDAKILTNFVILCQAASFLARGKD